MSRRRRIKTRFSWEHILFDGDGIFFALKGEDDDGARLRRVGGIWLVTEIVCIKRAVADQRIGLVWSVSVASRTRATAAAAEMPIIIRCACQSEAVIDAFLHLSSNCPLESRAIRVNSSRRRRRRPTTTTYPIKREFVILLTLNVCSATKVRGGDLSN